MLKRGAEIRWTTASGRELVGKIACVAKVGQTICDALKRDLDWTKVRTHGAADYDRYVVRVKVQYEYEFYALKVDGLEERIAKPKAPRTKKWAEPDWTNSCSECGATPVVPETGMCGPHTFGEADTAGGNW